MSAFWNTILKASRSISLLRLVRCFKLPGWRRADSNHQTCNSLLANPKAFNCRVLLAKQEDEGAVFDVFVVQICGSIHASSDTHRAIVRVSITDVTEGLSRARPVHSCGGQWQMQGSPSYCYEADLGKICNTATFLSDWTTIARLWPDRLMFPRKGKRNLRFSTSVVSGQTSEELARATCTFAYMNSELGYIDFQENIAQARTLAVALAFAVGVADNRLYNCQIELIRNWAKASMDFSKASDEARGELERALNKTVGFFREGNQLDIHKICRRIVELAPVAVRYDILELCLQVARVDGVATVEELSLLKALADWLEVDMDRFREMMGKILPVSMHQVRNLEFILGLNSQMSKTETRQRLNREYRKWNARVTNSDPEIRRQADSMLDFIAKVRSECIA
jgi:tellurite resistance protein